MLLSGSDTGFRKPKIIWEFFPKSPHPTAEDTGKAHAGVAHPAVDHPPAHDLVHGHKADVVVEQPGGSQLEPQTDMAHPHC